ncbi:hypothetical protein QQ056_01090 [Oscillatoria laete-virens NRMC-F 0139]|nr:hypothetical protein [Oscillatoria laete-virens]MDL5052166.1 hypothetical protein [Oscillatoria laete-virens NRMC-F 0139]
MEQSPSKKSPLNEPIKRAAGQARQERLDALRDDILIPAMMVSIFMLGLTAFEWVKYFFGSPPQPVVVTIAAMICIG